jgi:hypothetical protein
MREAGLALMNLVMEEEGRYLAGERSSTRNYGGVVKDFREAYGVEKSVVSDNFIASSRKKWRS